MNNSRLLKLITGRVPHGMGALLESFFPAVKPRNKVLRF